MDATPAWPTTVAAGEDKWAPAALMASAIGIANSIFFFGETLSGLQWLGGAAVLAGTYLAEPGSG
jgi:drug/metabolite transporter (DMT)-like permease